MLFAENLLTFEVVLFLLFLGVVNFPPGILGGGSIVLWLLNIVELYSITSIEFSKIVQAW